MDDEPRPNDRKNLAANLLIERVELGTGLGADADWVARNAACRAAESRYISKSVVAARENDRLFDDVAHRPRPRNKIYFALRGLAGSS